MVLNRCPHCNGELEEQEPSKSDDDSSSDSNTDEEEVPSYLRRGVRVVGYTGAAVAVGAAGLSLAGFGMAGIAANSFAAVWQASIGNVAAGSGFAMLQSAGATGMIATAGGGGAVVTAGALAADRRMREDNDYPEQNEGEQTDADMRCPHCGGGIYFPQ